MGEVPQRDRAGVVAPQPALEGRDPLPGGAPHRGGHLPAHHLQRVAAHHPGWVTLLCVLLFVVKDRKQNENTK